MGQHAPPAAPAPAVDVNDEMSSEDETVSLAGIGHTESTLAPLNEKKMLKFAKAFKEASQQEQLVMGARRGAAPEHARAAASGKRSANGRGAVGTARRGAGRGRCARVQPRRASTTRRAACSS